MNGKPGDHPLTDILVHGLPVFSPEVDQLIKEINDPVRRWEGQLIPLLFIALHSQLVQLRADGRHGEADTVLHNLVWTLRGERDRLI